MAIHASILAYEIPWTQEPGGLQFMGSQRARHDLETEQQQQHKMKFSVRNEPFLNDIDTYV